MTPARQAVRCGAVVLAGLATLSTAARALPCTANDRWTGPDKVRHLVVGGALGAGGTLLFDRPAAGLAIGAGAGLLREVLDRGSSTRYCSLQDFAATAIGAAVGAYGMSVFVAPERKGFVVGVIRRF